MRTAAVLVALVTTIVSACGAGATHSRQAAGRPQLVPWVDRPAPVYVAPQPPLPRYPTTAPPCQASQLRAAGSRVGVGMGNVMEQFSFRNVSRLTCLLRGFTRLSVESAAGRRVRLRARPAYGDTYSGSIIPADIGPGRTGEFLLVGTDMCDRAGPRYTAAAFGVPGGGWVSSDEPLTTPCPGWQITSLGLPQRYPNAPPHPSRGLGALTVSVRLPARIRPGSSLRYLVVLRNPTHSVIRLRPCPRYEELLFGAVVVQREYWLNCAAARPIGSGADERFAMVLSIPSGIGEPGKLSWVLGVPDSPAAVVFPGG